MVKQQKREDNINKNKIYLKRIANLHNDYDSQIFLFFKIGLPSRYAILKGIIAINVCQFFPFKILMMALPSCLSHFEVEFFWVFIMLGEKIS